MAFRWWADDGLLLVLYGSSVLPSSITKKKNNNPPPTKKKRKEKNVLIVGPPLRKHSWSAHDNARLPRMTMHVFLNWSKDSQYWFEVSSICLGSAVLNWCQTRMTQVLLLVKVIYTVNSEIFARILFSYIPLKDIFATIENSELVVIYFYR